MVRTRFRRPASAATGRDLSVGEAFVSKIVAFAGAAAAATCCLWLAPWKTLAAEAHDAGPTLVLAGGLFTVAIAVLIRD